ncbi:hypothetical protein [Streptomyces sp. MMG1533]|nr:hypothetical protein [Streptomyces sp. MMG1533]
MLIGGGTARVEEMRELGHLRPGACADVVVRDLYEVPSPAP